MSLGDTLKRPDVMIRLGLLAMAVGGFLRLFVHPAGEVWRDRLDGVTGFLTGVTIAAILLGLWKRRHQRA
jgi:hypothetical protein